MEQKRIYVFPTPQLLCISNSSAQIYANLLENKH